MRRHEPRAALQVFARVSHRDREPACVEERRIVRTIAKTHHLVPIQAQRGDEGCCRAPFVDPGIRHVDVIERRVPGRRDSPAEPKTQIHPLEIVQSGAIGRATIADDLGLDDVAILGGQGESPQIGYRGGDADQASVLDGLRVEAIDIMALGAIDLEADPMRTGGVDERHGGGDAQSAPEEHRPIGSDDQRAIETDRRPGHAEVARDQVDRVERPPRTQSHLDAEACRGPHGPHHALGGGRPTAADQGPIDIGRDEPNRRARARYRHRGIVADPRRLTRSVR